MKKFVYTITFLFLSLHTFSQREDRNVLALETGVFNKGNLGFSYSRLVQLHKGIELSAELAAGIGLGWRSEKNRYASGGVHFLIGKGEMKVSIGIDAKYYNLSLWDYQIQLFSSLEQSPKFEGITPSPAFGFVYQPRTGFYFKMRSSMNWFQSSVETRVRPGFGVSVGFTL